jgi:uncharacterized SAM-binding protein YcdF (DUF218 family)
VVNPQHGRRAPVLVLFLLAVALAAAVLVVGAHAGTALVVSHPLAGPDAIISLGSHEWERLPVAAELARANPDATVLLTLPRVVNEFNCHDCNGRIGRLVRAGVDPHRIRILPLTGTGTYGEARITAEFARGYRIKRLMIVTSPYHTRRSLAVFRSVLDGTGIEVGITPASRTSQAQPDTWWRTPYDRWYVRYEWAAIPYYLFRYRVNAFTLAP